MSSYIDPEKLRRHRERSGMSVEEAAVRVRRSVEFVQKAESTGAFVSASELGAISASLGLHRDDLTGPAPRPSIKGADLRSAMSGDHGQGGISGSERLAARLFPATGD